LSFCGRFLVRSVNVEITPTIDQTVTQTKSDICYVYAQGGSLSSNEESTTCSLKADKDGDVVACRNGAVTTASGDGGVQHGPDQGAGSCEWSL